MFTPHLPPKLLNFIPRTNKSIFIATGGAGSGFAVLPLLFFKVLLNLPNGPRGPPQPQHAHISPAAGGPGSRLTCSPCSRGRPPTTSAGRQGRGKASCRPPVWLAFYSFSFFLSFFFFLCRFSGILPGPLLPAGDGSRCLFQEREKAGDRGAAGFPPRAGPALPCPPGARPGQLLQAHSGRPPAACPSVCLTTGKGVGTVQHLPRHREDHPGGTLGMALAFSAKSGTGARDQSPSWLGPSPSSLG